MNALCKVIGALAFIVLANIVTVIALLAIGVTAKYLFIIIGGA